MCAKSGKELRLRSGDNTLSGRQQWLLAAEQQGKRGSAGLRQSRQGEEKVGMITVVRQGGGVVCSGDSLEKGKRWGGGSVGKRRTPGRMCLGSHVSQTGVGGDGLAMSCAIPPGEARKGGCFGASTSSYSGQTVFDGDYGGIRR